MKKGTLLIGILMLMGCTAERATAPDIIPRPVEMTVADGSFRLTDSTPIYYSNESLVPAARYLRTVISQVTGNELPIMEGSASNFIALAIDPLLGPKDKYTLTSDRNGIQITGANERSVMMGIQTLRQMMPMADATLPINIQAVSITDSPKWEWRGMMLDVARHFYTKDEVKQFIDLLAMYKFNKFHWHLSDDEGWRIEIKKYPLLTEQGGWRTFNSHDRECLRLAGAESNTDYQLQADKLRNNGTEYGGYYTQEDIKEVVEYAAMLGIDVIPEIDMPGHFTAAINSYPTLSCFNKPSWGQVFSAPICPGKDATLEFCKDVYAEVFALFPYEYVHLGGDEVEKDNWIKCPHCQARMRAHNLKDEKQLQSWFIDQMEQFFIANGKKMIGWDEILEGGTSKTSTIMWWRTWAGNAVQEATSQGNEVILTPNSHYYFDYKQDASTLRKLYEFQPVPAGISDAQRSLVKGIQANLWAEWIPSFKRSQYMFMPRMLALSEQAWTPDASMGWEDFHSRLVSHFPRLDAMGINYRPLDLEGVHVTNAFVGEKLIEWDYPLPAVEIHYTTDGTVPDRNSTLYTGPFTINQSTDFTIRFFRPDGSAADIVKTSYKKEEYRQGEDATDKQPGLKAEWHEVVVNKCADIEKHPIKQEFVVNEIAIPKGVSTKCGMKYAGYLHVDKDDIYTFALSSDDGSMLYIHDEVVVDNDGPHGPTTLNGQMALGAGYHPFVLYYFDMNNGGFVDLKIYDSTGAELTPAFFR